MFITFRGGRREEEEMQWRVMVRNCWAGSKVSVQYYHDAAISLREEYHPTSKAAQAQGHPFGTYTETLYECGRSGKAGETSKGNVPVPGCRDFTEDAARRMIFYADRSFVISLLTEDAFSKKAWKWWRVSNCPVRDL
jgi:hypothetical protein